jgi:farnesyl diphosphate synthase
MNTVIGQGLDLVTPPNKTTENDQFDFQNYTQEQYDSIVKWKTAYYSFCLPVQSALYLCLIDNEEVHRKCRDILLEMGYFFQVQVT